jgi:tripartite-type tricarboxylate transporter receptor subunit TctC
LPEVPTIGEAGLPLVNVVPWGGFVVPASTPRDVANTLAKALREAINQPEMRAPADKAGLVLRPTSGEAFGKLLVEQLAAYGQAIKTAKVPVES